MTELDPTLEQVADARVLAIDDLVANTTLIERILNRAGLPGVTAVNDPLLVAGLLTDVDPDLVLLDLKMPGLDGFEVLTQVLRHAAGAFLPVIVITADDSHGNVARALDLGAHDFVAKPFDATELVLRVRNLLLTRAAYQELRRSRAWLRARLQVFDPGQVEDIDAVRALVLDTMRSDTLQIALQPIVDMRDGRLVGAEALSRFPDSALGNPGAWFMAAEQVGLGIDLEMHAARKALALMGDRPHGSLLSVNVSPAAVLDDLRRHLGEDVPWDRVVLELTEHTPVEDYAVLKSALAPLRAQGAQLAIDDAGAGFASLRHIANLEPSIIKLDIGITRGVDVDPSRAAIAEMLVSFAERMQVSVIAEGVETESERDTLLELGLRWGQGYLLGRPALVG